MALAAKTNETKRKWILDFCECRVYRDKYGKNEFYPLFCPVASFCPSFLVGAICSRIRNETPLCCDMGCLGWLCCCSTIPIQFQSMGMATFGTMGLFTCYSCWLRRQVVEKYNVEEDLVCCWEHLDLWHYACNYPCSLFQMYVSIKQWESEAKEIPQIPPPVVTIKAVEATR